MGNTSNLFNVENSKIQSATFGPTPESFKSSSLTWFVSFISFNFEISTSLFKIILVVSYNLISLKPNPNSLYSSTETSFNSSTVGKV